MEFYSDLFKAGITDKQLQDDILRHTRHTQRNVTMEQQSLCDKELNITDLEQGMKQLPSGKSPGTDGLPVEFYQTMWHLIRFDFLETVSGVYQSEILSNYLTRPRNFDFGSKLRGTVVEEMLA